MRIAIIDLGTNTFNLLIVELELNSIYKTIYQTKISVKLGEGGINKGFIAAVPFQRGVNAIKEYKKIIDSYVVVKVYAFATSAVRGASNGKEFAEEIKRQTGIDVRIISGDKEAELIYYGVYEAVDLGEDASLIIDIGGGSTEFIIANKNKIFWKHSFLLGAARLLEKFVPSDPITDAENKEICHYLKQELELLFKAVKEFPVKELIGSSGSFDSIAEMIVHKFYTPEILDDKTEYDFDLTDFEDIYNNVLLSSREDRLKMKGLVEMRVDMIVISSILIKFILSSFEINKMRLSTYSLKEGALNEMLKNKSFV